MGELRLERREILACGEVVPRLRPAGDRVHDPIDQLADAGLAARRTDVAAEVLADDDVGGELAPERRDLDVLLLEDGLAGLIADVGGPDLPRDLVIRMDTRASPAAGEREALRRPALLIHPIEADAVRAAVAGRGRRCRRGALRHGRRRRRGLVLGGLHGGHRGGLAAVRGGGGRRGGVSLFARVGGGGGGLGGGGGCRGGGNPGPEMTRGSRRSPLSITGMPSPLVRAIAALSLHLETRNAGR